MNRSIVAVVVAGLVLAGCGDDKPAYEPLPWQVPGPAGKDGIDGMDGEPGKPGAAGKDAALSGTRLKARFYAGEDGSRQPIGWYDSEREEACEWKTFAGEVRCMPTAKGKGTTKYTTPACKDPDYAWVGPKGGYVIVDPWIRGASDTTVGQIYDLDAEGTTCMPFQAPNGETWFTWEKLELSLFVKATEKIDH